MKKFLIPLLAVIALPTTANATNYVECEAIYSLLIRTENQKEQKRRDYREYGEKYPSLYKKTDVKPYEEVLERALKDYKKRGCYGL